jgi:hypothetical protein
MMSAATRSSLIPDVLQGLVQPVDLTRAFLDLGLAIAREIAQLADRLGRHEARLQQPGLGKPAQPRRVGHIGLAARNLLDVARVDEQALEFVFEDRPGRLPVDAGGSITTCWTVSQSRSRSSPPTVAGNSAMRSSRSPRSFGTRTHAVTCALCTSSAAGRSTIVSTKPPSRR